MPPLKVECTMKEEIINLVSIGGPNIRVEVHNEFGKERVEYPIRQVLIFLRVYEETQTESVCWWTGGQQSNSMNNNLLCDIMGHSYE